LRQTYDVNTQVGDSAATANAMFSGVKTKHGTFGFGPNVIREDPSTMTPEDELTTLLDWAQAKDMDTGALRSLPTIEFEHSKNIAGIVSTAKITHATPAALYAKVADRDWECNAPPDTPEEYESPVLQFFLRCVQVPRYCMAVSQP